MRYVWWGLCEESTPAGNCVCFILLRCITRCAASQSSPETVLPPLMPATAIAKPTLSLSSSSFFLHSNQCYCYWCCWRCLLICADTIEVPLLACMLIPHASLSLSLCFLLHLVHSLCLLDCPFTPNSLGGSIHHSRSFQWYNSYLTLFYMTPALQFGFTLPHKPSIKLTTTWINPPTFSFIFFSFWFLRLSLLYYIFLINYSNPTDLHIHLLQCYSVCYQKLGLTIFRTDHSAYYIYNYSHCHICIPARFTSSHFIFMPIYVQPFINIGVFYKLCHLSIIRQKLIIFK